MFVRITILTTYKLYVYKRINIIIYQLLLTKFLTRIRGHIYRVILVAPTLLKGKNVNASRGNASL